MTAEPQWTDSGQGDLLALVAMGNVATDTAEQEWDLYVRTLEFCAVADDGLIRPNTLRAVLDGQVAPQRCGAFANRALSRKLIQPTGDWQVSNDHHGKSAGKPARVYRWLGT